MRDNETIMALIGDCESHIKSRLIELIKADASADTIRCFVECLNSLQCATSNMGERRYLDSPDAVRSIAIEAISPVEKQLHQLLEKLEKWESKEVDRGEV